MNRTQLERKYGKHIQIGGKQVRRFIPHPMQVRDGTCRCIGCGQIDEPEYHDSNACRDARTGGSYAE